ncbi:acyltransferase, partial [Staphylococcus ureilyticus]
DIGQVFQDKVPKAVIDGKVGRQLIEAKPLVQGSYSNYNSPKQDVVLELGTNGDFTKAQLDELIGTLKDANIYLVTTRV